MMEEIVEKQEKLSQEEIENNRKKLMEYYESNIPFLKLQAEYEALITNIQESKTARLIAQIQFAQIMAPPQEEESNSSEKDTNVRKLKKD